jgi:hypothetical protein
MVKVRQIIKLTYVMMLPEEITHVHHLMTCKGVIPTTMSGCLSLGSMYMHREWNMCLGIHVLCIDMYVSCSKINDIDFGYMYYASRFM